MFDKDNLPPGLAPHRLLYTNDPPSPETWKEAKQSAAYQPGDIIAVERDGKLRFAIVDYVMVSRDRFGDLQAYWRVRLFRKDGTLATPYRRQPYVWPGPVQRGYKLAGLAPEMPDWV